MAVFDDVISSPLLTDGFALHMFVSSIHQLIVFDPSTGNILIITIYSAHYLQVLLDPAGSHKLLMVRARTRRQQCK